MGTQLIMTVGTNALPIWVAWYHLKDELEPAVKVRLVHTAETQSQVEALEKYCQGADFLDPIMTEESGDPSVVYGDIQDRILDDFPEGTLHVHYTGGTKVMGVETVSAIGSMITEGYSLERSYLDPRGDDGPRIMRWSSVRGGSGEPVPDTRIGIPVEPKAGEPDHIALIRIAELNGIEIGPCTYADRNGGTVECRPPNQPTEENIREGQQNVSNGFATYTGSAKRRGTLLEYAAYGSFHEALNNICSGKKERCNYKIFRSVEGVVSGSRKHFELDVVAVLGHQVVVVSCDASNPRATRYNRADSTSYETSIKRKAMEVYHRAKQLGGDEARAVMLCNGDRVSAEIIQEELQDETGSPDFPIQVWGSEAWHDLTCKFTDYLQDDLRWK